MQKGHRLEINCINCSQQISFSIFSLKEENNTIACTRCNKRYSFDDETLIRQLDKFEKLCLQLHDSEEILSNASVGIDVGSKHVTIPYKLLLTRLSSTLDLQIGDQHCSIAFRIEPAVDLNPAHLNKNK